MPNSDFKNTRQDAQSEAFLKCCPNKFGSDIASMMEIGARLDFPATGKLDFGDNVSRASLPAREVRDASTSRRETFFEVGR